MSIVQLCALKYRPPHSPLSAADGPVLLLACKSDLGLTFYLHPGLDQQTSTLDHEYLHQLIPDLLERARTAPEDVFKQLCQLSVGPLVAQPWVEDCPSVDTLIRERYPDLLRLA